jgi:hypothetical protein
MRVASTLLALTSAASGMLYPRTNAPSNETMSPTPNVVAAQYDGKCFYPVPDSRFSLNSYLGTWYQVAGTPFGPTAGARCVTANYQLNVRYGYCFFFLSLLHSLAMESIHTTIINSNDANRKMVQSVFSTARPQDPRLLASLALLRLWLPSMVSLVRSKSSFLIPRLKKAGVLVPTILSKVRFFSVGFASR